MPAATAAASAAATYVARLWLDARQDKSRQEQACRANTDANRLSNSDANLRRNFFEIFALLTVTVVVVDVVVVLLMLLLYWCLLWALLLSTEMTIIISAQIYCTTLANVTAS